MKKTILIFSTILFSLSLSGQIMRDTTIPKKLPYYRIRSLNEYIIAHHQAIDTTHNKSITIKIDDRPYHGPPPLFIIDGKIKKHAPKRLDVTKIKSISVLSGKKAVTQYGDKGKFGVVFITTKTTSH